MQYLKEGKDYFLRITIDKPGGVMIEDCEKVNQAIDEILDTADMIKTSYFLEVSSPGIERILRKPWHFEKQIGNKIQLKLFKSVNQQKNLEGILRAFQEDRVELQIEDECIEIEKKNIAIAKVVADIF